jgi:subtilase family serine protease
MLVAATASRANPMRLVRTSSGADLMRVGREPAAPAGAIVGGAVAAATPLHVTVTLTPRDPAALAAYALAVSTPGSPDYRRYLTPAQFGRRFGATPAAVAAVRASLRARGLSPGPASTGALSIPVSGTATQLERAFAISLRKLSLPGRRAAIVATAAPAFDAGAAVAVQAVLGLDTVSAPHPLLIRGGSGGAGRRLPLAARHIATGGPQPCPAVQAQAPGQFAYTADQIASAYGFPGLYDAGDLGAGVTVAVYELEADDPADLAAYEACYGIDPSITSVPVDGGAGRGPGAGEAALDIENLIAIAPDVTVLVYQGPNSDSGAPGSGPYDTFSAIINQDRAQVVSVSWGECEAELGRPDAMAENTLFEQATVQGQTIVAASGDDGSEDCDGGSPLPDTALAVDDPSSQPFVTGVGGTSLQQLGPPPVESVWNSGSGQTGVVGQPGASGGGISSFWPMPAAQTDAAASLGVLTAAAAGSGCENTGGWCREVPDVSADANPATGYMIYWNGSGAIPTEPEGWQGIGGTSAAAPVWAALLALADASPGCADSPVGYADPALYRAAGLSYAADLNDVTTGDNDFTATNGGRYAAGPGYDTASGLGTPNAMALVSSLCDNTVRLVGPPGARRSTVNTRVSLSLHGTDAPGFSLIWGATGLPPGVTLSADSGEITGSPKHTGMFVVRVTARDGEDATASSTFVWTVGAAPRISALSLITTSTGAPQLAFTVTAGRGAPDIELLQVTLPRGLRLDSRRGITVTFPRAPGVRYEIATRHPSTVTITLGAPAAEVRLTFGPPGLAIEGGRLPATSAGLLALGVLDASAGQSRLSAAVTL